MPEIVPEVVVMRLPLYVRVLAMLEASKQELVSSQTLGTLLQATPAQIRKDLSYFGRFGKQGRGYRVSHLLQELQRIMGLDREWSMALVGVGQLGRAILSYAGFVPQGFHISQAFDADPAKIGTSVGNMVIQDLKTLEAIHRCSPRGHRYRRRACRGLPERGGLDGALRHTGHPQLRTIPGAGASRRLGSGHRPGGRLAEHDLLLEDGGGADGSVVER